MKKTVFLVLASLLLLQLPAGSAADKSAAPALLQKADPRVELAAKMPGTKPEDLRASRGGQQGWLWWCGREGRRAAGVGSKPLPLPMPPNCCHGCCRLADQHSMEHPSFHV